MVFVVGRFQELIDCFGFLGNYWGFGGRLYRWVVSVLVVRGIFSLYLKGICCVRL